jgi:hypothetical protein
MLIETEYRTMKVKQFTTYDEEARYLDCQTWRDVAGSVRDCVTSGVNTACYMHRTTFSVNRPVKAS